MVSIGQLIDWFRGQGNTCLVNGADLTREIVAPRAIDLASAENISFVGRKNVSAFVQLILATKSRILIVDSTLFESNRLAIPAGIGLILSEDPKADLIRVCGTFFKQTEEEATIHPSAVISNKASLGDNVTIGPNARIESGVKVGSGTVIGAGTIVRHAEIGANCSIGMNSVIGGVGFGYSKLEGEQAYMQFPHFGKVIIGNDVEVGSNVCIDRGSLSDTVLNDGVKVDNLVHIAHNVVVGSNTLIIACSMIGGSTQIGANSWIAPSSCIRNGITIGNNVTIGLGSTVTKNVSDGLTVLGSPAVEIEEYKRQRSFLKAK